MSDAEPHPPPRPGELAAVLVAGAVHVGAEVLVSERVAFGWSAAVALGFAVYLVRRARRTPGLRRAWGMRIDNLARALPAHVGFAAAGLAAILVWSRAEAPLRVPDTLWLTLVLYPAWGVAQQFALQHLIAGNLADRLRSPLPLALLGALLFAASHVPRFDLALLTLLGGVPFILVYRAFPNLWAVGLAHGILGTAAAYFVLGEDPGAALVGWLR